MSQRSTGDNPGMAREQQPEYRLRSFALIQSIPPDIRECFMSIAQYGMDPDQVKSFYIKFRENLGGSGAPRSYPSMEYPIEISTETHGNSSPFAPNESRRDTITTSYGPPSSTPGLPLGPSPGAMALSMEKGQNTPFPDQVSPFIISPVSVASGPDAATTPVVSERQSYTASIPWDLSTDSDFPTLTSDYPYYNTQHPGLINPLGITFTDSPTSRLLSTKNTSMPTYVPSPTQLHAETSSVRKPSADLSLPVSRTNQSEKRIKKAKSSKITKLVPPSRRHKPSLSSPFTEAQLAEIQNSSSPSAPVQQQHFTSYPARTSFSSSYRSPQPSPQQVSESYLSHSMLTNEPIIQGRRSTFANMHRPSLSTQELTPELFECPGFPPRYPPSSS